METSARPRRTGTPVGRPVDDADELIATAESIQKRRHHHHTVTTEEPTLMDLIIRRIWQPHTVTAFLFTLGILIHFASVPDQDLRNNIFRGSFAVVSLILVFAALHFPDGIMRRPSRMFWRLVLGVSLVYVGFLSFLLFQDLATVRSIFHFLDPKLALQGGVERSYLDQGCDIYTPNHPNGRFANVLAVWKDEFVLAHVLGYVAKAIMLRDWRLVTMMSIVFELLEVALQHQLPNFNECWWDHLIVDVLLCNAIGTGVGIAIVKFFNGQSYSWVGTAKPTAGPRSVVVNRLRETFMPLSFVLYNWDMFSSVKRFLYVWFVIIAINLVDVHAFYLKSLIGIPPPHPFNVYRLIIWWAMGSSALREYYHFVIHKDVRALGAQAWVATAAVGLEVVLIRKLTSEMPELAVGWPFYIAYPAFAWLAILAIFLALFLFGAVPRTSRTLRAVYFLSMVPLAALFVMGNADLKWGREGLRSILTALGLPAYDPDDAVPPPLGGAAAAAAAALQPPVVPLVHGTVPDAAIPPHH